MKSKEFIRKIVLPTGAVLLKRDGTHQIFELPNGQRFHVPTGGRNHTEAGAYLQTRFRRLMAMPDDRKRREKPGGPA
jgi:predicted RNA binding protein YcfA (HicA-like mRNA interferase family)